MKGGLPWRRCPKEHQFMSRSYRQPYAATTGVQSASRDKQQASHSVRRRINQWLHIQYAKGGEFELVPHRLECQHNDVWCWDRDGKRRLQVPDARDWSCHCLAVNGSTLSRTENGAMNSGRPAGTSGCGGSKRGGSAGRAHRIRNAERRSVRCRYAPPSLQAGS